MRNPIDIEHANSRAIWEEIGERLQQYLKVEPELPASIRRQVERLGGPPSSIAPDPEPQTGQTMTWGDVFVTTAIAGVLCLIGIGLFVALG